MPVLTTRAQRLILRYALGLHYINARDRNWYASGPDCPDHADVMALVEQGLLVEGRPIPGGLSYYHVTEMGKGEVS